MGGRGLGEETHNRAGFSPALLPLQLPENVPTSGMRGLQPQPRNRRVDDKPSDLPEQEDIWWQVLKLWDSSDPCWSGMGPGESEEVVLAPDPKSPPSVTEGQNSLFRPLLTFTQSTKVY